MKIVRLVAFCLIAGISLNARAVPLYSATRLNFDATAINNRGQIVGENNAGSLVWRKGETLQLGATGAVDINDRGAVLGSDWLWDKKGLTQGAFTGAVALNNHGKVVGNSPGDRAFTWDLKTGASQIRIFGDERFLSANGIADDGSVLLQWDVWNGYGVWSSETDNAKLPAVFGCCGLNTNAVINSHGYIGGISITGGDPAFLGPLVEDLPPGIPDCGSNGCDAITIWTPELTPIYIGLHSLEDFFFADGFQRRSLGVTGVNDDLLVVGSYESFQHLEWRAYVGSEELGVLDLNDLLTKRAQSLLGGATLRTAQGINDRGWILAKTRDGASYLLRPVPEPGAILLLLVAGAMLLVRRLRTSTTAN